MRATTLNSLAQQLRQFAEARDWDQFHAPKNLAMALVAEAGELVAELQWLTVEQSYELDEQHLSRIQDEAADVLIYLVRLADKLNFDLLDAASAKIEKNEKRYPADSVRGSAKKRDGL